MQKNKQRENKILLCAFVAHGRIPSKDVFGESKDESHKNLSWMILEVELGPASRSRPTSLY